MKLRWIEKSLPCPFDALQTQVGHLYLLTVTLFEETLELPSRFLREVREVFRTRGIVYRRAALRVEERERALQLTVAQPNSSTSLNSQSINNEGGVRVPRTRPPSVLRPSACELRAHSFGASAYFLHSLIVSFPSNLTSPHLIQLSCCHATLKQQLPFEGTDFRLLLPEPRGSARGNHCELTKAKADLRVPWGFVKSTANCPATQTSRVTGQ